MFLNNIITRLAEPDKLTKMQGRLDRSGQKII